jgi:hypothetical protein
MIFVVIKYISLIFLAKTVPFWLRPKDDVEQEEMLDIEGEFLATST